MSNKVKTALLLAWVSVVTIASMLHWVDTTSAYTFSAWSWLIIEQGDVDNVSNAVWVGIASYLQVLKFIWIAILVGVSTFIVNKIFSIWKVG